ncbi:ancient ubiquitous protein 1-like isoform X1 [Scleropages formosus]|uniref:AUP1 lipid droplet regulating VLDL assembly factor n=1 Tax=Scleropages formosus TaxID=113540 RepID=A0A8C9RJ88_SCLFO|nr:ancient ubiquitous protein 1-like isoform X1 [Scleropages formosus]
MMETPGIEQLFDFQRWPSDAGVPPLLLLALYAPLGLALLLLRLVIGAHVFLVSCTLPDCLLRRLFVRFMCSVLGMHVKRSHRWPPDRSVRLYTCNHVTPFDHNMISLLTSCSTPMLEGSTGFMCWARGFLELDAVSGKAHLMAALQQYCCSDGLPPLLLFPEEETTNGRAGLLRFSSWAFSVSDCVQPVALRVKRPFLPLSVAESSWVTELLWTLFIPFTVYQVRWLPPMTRDTGDSPQEFADKVQELLAAELGMAPTRVTRADKAEYLKRKRHPTVLATNSSVSLASHQPAHPVGLQVPSSGLQGGHMSKMAQQVKEVLPSFPLAVITQDLACTNCVNTTITNLLEEHGDTWGERSDETSAGPSRSSLVPRTMPPPRIESHANTFEKSPVDRHLSLQERKEALYAYARRCYIEKHGLSVD